MGPVMIRGLKCGVRFRYVVAGGVSRLVVYSLRKLNLRFSRRGPFPSKVAIGSVTLKLDPISDQHPDDYQNPLGQRPKPTMISRGDW